MDEKTYEEIFEASHKYYYQLQFTAHSPKYRNKSGTGNTDYEAITDFAKRNGLKLWNEEEV